MKRLPISLILLFGVCRIALASWINADDALSRASSFFYGSRRTMQSSALTRVWPEKIRPAAESGVSDKTPLYIFNCGSSGYVLVSGSDKTVPVLGYSLNHSFVTENMPDNLRWWLSRYEDYITSVEADPSFEGITQTSAVATGEEHQDVVKYQTALWNQYEPYNLLCPVYNGRRSVTGCTNTALAIVMKHFGWPAAGEGTLDSYYNGENPVPGHTLGHTYDWDSMPLEYNTGSYNDYQASQVARIMYDLGVMNQSLYDPDGTGTIVNFVPEAMASHMLYRDDAEYVMASDYASSVWVSMIQQQLSDIGPLVMGGSGHSFVLDGYDNIGFFSFNFGWGGVDNGYFSLVAIPGYEDRQTTFTDGQHIFYNLCPDYSKDVDITLDEAEILSDWNYVPDEPFTLKYDLTLSNGIPCPFAADMKFALINKAGQIKEMIGSIIPLNIESSASCTLSGEMACSISNRIVSGDFVVPFYRHPRSKKWLRVPGNYGGLAVGDDSDIEQCTSLDYDVKTRILTITCPETAHFEIYQNEVFLSADMNIAVHTLAVPEGNAVFRIRVNNYLYVKEFVFEIKTNSEAE